MREKPDYGNWVPMSVFKTMAPTLIAMAVMDGMSLKRRYRVRSVLLTGLLIAGAGLTAYMWKCRQLFSFDKGGLMGDIHAFLLQHLTWDGQGELLDIGCGAGALSIRSAKAYPEAKVTGMDFWGKEWNYAKEQCERNAEIEGVAERTRFEKGDAACLDYLDESFDAAVSNFVFHEVRTEPDKRKVVREALRVVKKGGAFAFQDMFGQEKLYGDMEEFIELLKQEGITEIHYIPDVDKLPFIPGYVRAPWMLNRMGIIYGIK